mmetsp:Transcript_33331/g.66337  ORF Transcript_33331/g.66337 Transcript_33331/m.66337 type:complete len:161 (-) Transcript_33331:1039-1521(-)
MMRHAAVISSNRRTQESVLEDKSSLPTDSAKQASSRSSGDGEAQEGAAREGDRKGGSQKGSTFKSDGMTDGEEQRAEALEEGATEQAARAREQAESVPSTSSSGQQAAVKLLSETYGVASGLLLPRVHAFITWIMLVAALNVGFGRLTQNGSQIRCELVT